MGSIAHGRVMMKDAHVGETDGFQNVLLLQVRWFRAPLPDEQPPPKTLPAARPLAKVRA